MNKPVLCLDFDGVLHSYTSGWKGAAFIPDPPVPGAMAFLAAMVDRFDVVIHSTRNHHDYGIAAICDWLRFHLTAYLGSAPAATLVVRKIHFPVVKPPAFLTLDDRAWTFTGRFPSYEEIAAFRPWYQREAVHGDVA